MLPGDKIMDATAMVLPEGDLVFVVMSTAGHVYMQPVEEACSAKYGPFFMTNSLPMESKDLQVCVVGTHSNITLVWWMDWA